MIELGTSILLLFYSSWVRGTSKATFFSFFGALVCISALRNLPITPVTFIGVTLAAILFWVAQSIRLSFSSLRTLILLAVGMSFALFIFQDLFPFSKDYESGSWRGLDLTPSSIASLQSSHEKAFDLYLDHYPTEDDRYFKLGSLSQTENGLDYRVGNATDLDPKKFPKTAEWVNTQHKETSLELNIQKIRLWWEGKFRYSLDPGKMKSEAPLDDFLFDKQNGFCQHYAAALATLLKLEGYRARVIVGFAGGSWNPLTRSLTFEMGESHAWTEVFNTQVNQWMRVDPTTWVAPEANRFFPILRAFAWVFLFLLFAIGAAILYFRNSDPVEFIFAKLERAEKKLGLRAEGLTLKERLERVGSKIPGQKKLLETVVVLYQEEIYSEKANPANRIQLRKQARRLFNLLNNIL